MQCLRSLNGYRATAEILELVPDIPNFQVVLKAVKLWAKKNGIYGNILGFPGGFSWTILVAKICQMNKGAGPSELVHRFFLTWSSWSWPDPVYLRQPGPQPYLAWNPKLNPQDKTHLGRRAAGYRLQYCWQFQVVMVMTTWLIHVACSTTTRLINMTATLTRGYLLGLAVQVVMVMTTWLIHVTCSTTTRLEVAQSILLLDMIGVLFICLRFLYCVTDNYSYSSQTPIFTATAVS